MISKIYNLNRLGQSSDEVTLEASESERTELAELAKRIECAGGDGIFRPHHFEKNLAHPV